MQKEFGPEIYALRHGVGDCKEAQHVSIIGDGALWIWNIHVNISMGQHENC